ncbi:MAG: hypothetical protein Roseis2KO_48450 [Roseivirga sp.]
MSFTSTIYRVLIASPSDVQEEREITARIIQSWNDVNSFSKKIVLLPVRWETHSSPSYDIRPQQAINLQIVDSVDLVIGLFWTKIGTDTGSEISGTIEEIKRAADSGKDVMIYFSKRGVSPSEIDINQLTTLNDFKSQVYKNALVESYNSLVDFRDKLTRQLEFKIRELQKGNKQSKSNLQISFIKQETGELDNTSIQIEATKISKNNKEIEKLPEVKNLDPALRWHFRSEINEYTKRQNSVPIVIGIKNTDSIIHNNLNIDLQIMVDASDSIGISTVGSPDRYGISRHLDDGQLREQDKKNIVSLYTDNPTKLDDITMSVPTEQITILPNRVKFLKPLLILYPSKSVKIEILVKVLSNTLLNPIEKTLSLRIELNQRDLRRDEIKSIIDFIDEPDDLPF